MKKNIETINVEELKDFGFIVSEPYEIDGIVYVDINQNTEN